MRPIAHLQPALGMAARAGCPSILSVHETDIRIWILISFNRYLKSSQNATAFSFKPNFVQIYFCQGNTICYYQACPQGIEAEMYTLGRYSDMERIWSNQTIEFWMYYCHWKLLLQYTGTKKSQVTDHVHAWCMRTLTSRRLFPGAYGYSFDSLDPWS